MSKEISLKLIFNSGYLFIGSIVTSRTLFVRMFPSYALSGQTELPDFNLLGPVAKRADDATQRRNRYPADK